MSDTKVERVYCPACLARFRFIEGWAAGSEVRCPICGQMLTLRRTDEGWVGDRIDEKTEKEIRARVDAFAEIRGYAFNNMKEDIMEGLMGKLARFGDFYCPCRMMHVPEYQCPCKPTRGGDVERNGKCFCGLFWRKDAVQNV